MACLNDGEFARWMRSARATLESARADLESGFYNWACFKAHQATEKALKAVLWGAGRPAVGHSLVALATEVERLGLEVPADVREHCYALSKYYTITRYPDAWESGAPEDYFTRREAEEAISAAERVLAWVEGVWRGLRGRERS